MKKVAAVLTIMITGLSALLQAGQPNPRFFPMGFDVPASLGQIFNTLTADQGLDNRGYRYLLVSYNPRGAESHYSLKTLRVNPVSRRYQLLMPDMSNPTQWLDPDQDIMAQLNSYDRALLASRQYQVLGAANRNGLLVGSLSKSPQDSLKPAWVKPGSTQWQLLSVPKTVTGILPIAVSGDGQLIIGVATLQQSSWLFYWSLEADGYKLHQVQDELLAKHLENCDPDLEICEQLYLNAHSENLETSLFTLHEQFKGFNAFMLQRQGNALTVKWLPDDDDYKGVSVNRTGDTIAVYRPSDAQIHELNVSNLEPTGRYSLSQLGVEESNWAGGIPVSLNPGKCALSGILKFPKAGLNYIGYCDHYIAAASALEDSRTPLNYLVSQIGRSHFDLSYTNQTGTTLAEIWIAGSYYQSSPQNNNNTWSFLYPLK
ncbi:MAG: hypothetical protein ACR2PT_10785 [Endozoicomonas sp.]